MSSEVLRFRCIGLKFFEKLPVFSLCYEMQTKADKNRKSIRHNMAY